MSVEDIVAVSKCRGIQIIQKYGPRKIVLARKSPVKVIFVVLPLGYGIIDGINGFHFQPADDIRIDFLKRSKINGIFHFFQIIAFRYRGIPPGIFCHGLVFYHSIFIKAFRLLVCIRILLQFFIFIHTGFVFQINGSQLHTCKAKHSYCQKNDQGTEIIPKRFFLFPSVSFFSFAHDCLLLYRPAFFSWGNGGRYTVNVVYFRSLVARIWPPWSSTISLAMDSPKPAPPV